jgi:hypothetical protein
MRDYCDQSIRTRRRPWGIPIFEVTFPERLASVFQLSKLHTVLLTTSPIGQNSNFLGHSLKCLEISPVVAITPPTPIQLQRQPNRFSPQPDRVTLPRHRRVESLGACAIKFPPGGISNLTA